MSQPSWIGQVLGGRYKITEILGQGGMSAVYKATDPNLKRVVAVKLIHPHLSSDPRFLVRFEEEATAVARLRHPNIVQVYDFNHDGDVYYMVQEFVAGETLQSRLRRVEKAGRRLPLEEAIQITLDICNATGYAHQRSMVHRDIKPANIMLDVNGQAILMDFGIVKIVGGERHTATGAVVGTALYMSPELIRGQDPDSRADIYSLGVTLFEMVSGRPPFEADSAMSLMMMHLNDPLPDMHQLRPEVPEILIAVIGKALAKDRNKRYNDMSEMAAALKAVGAHLQTDAPLEATQIDIGDFAASVAAQPALRSEPVTTSPALTGTPIPANGISAPSAPILSSSPTGAGYYAGPPAVGFPGPLSPDSGSIPTMKIGGGEIPAATAGSGFGGAGFYSPSAPVAISQSPRKGISPWILLAGAAVIVILAVAGVAIGRGMSGGKDAPVVALVDSTATPKAVATLTPPSSLTPTITLTPTPKIILTATNTPTITSSPTPTIPVGVPYVRINRITVDDQGRYTVEYETFEYTEKLPGMHIHFFFNTVPPDQAGRPGNGPWYVYGGPRPFDKFRTIDRPKDATSICALVANSDHSVQSNSGTCLSVPDVVIATLMNDTACYAGPGNPYPVVINLGAGQVTRVQAISMDESWWIVTNPNDPQGVCWVPLSTATTSGDIGTLGVEQPPPVPTETTSLSVVITAITIDNLGRYVVRYKTNGFIEQLPGTHLHFFFNTSTADQVGLAGTGNRLMYGGPSPFTGYKVSDRPVAATQMCVLVANPNRSIIPNSGNCFSLPASP